MYKVRLLGPLALEDNDLRLVVALAIRPGESRTEHELGTLLWGADNWAYDPNADRLRSPITRVRRHLDIPNKQRGISAYKADLSRSAVDLTDFIDRANAESLNSDEIDYLLGLWTHDPSTAFAFLPKSEFNPLQRARHALIARLADRGIQELAKLTNLERFRVLFEEECAEIPIAVARREKRLLVVDDNEGLTAMLKGLLGGFETVVANEAAKAMAIITDPSARIDGALVDLHLTARGNDNQGISVLDALRYQRPEVPRVLMTSSPPPESIRRFTELYGLFDLLVKNGPDAPAHTRRTVEEMLSDDPKHAVARARTTLRTLAGRAQQFAQRAVVAATRREKLGDESGESLLTALERLDAIYTASNEILETLEQVRTSTAADDLVAKFGLDFADCLTDEPAR